MKRPEVILPIAVASTALLGILALTYSAANRNEDKGPTAEEWGKAFLIQDNLANIHAAQAAGRVVFTLVDGRRHAEIAPDTDADGIDNFDVKSYEETCKGKDLTVQASYYARPSDSPPTAPLNVYTYDFGLLKSPVCAEGSISLASPNI